MIISHVKIIAFQTVTNHSFWTLYIGGKPVVNITNRKIHGCLEIPDLFHVLNVIFLNDIILYLKHECSDYRSIKYTIVSGMQV